MNMYSINEISQIVFVNYLHLIESKSNFDQPVFYFDLCVSYLFDYFLKHVICYLYLMLTLTSFNQIICYL